MHTQIEFSGYAAWAGGRISPYRRNPLLTRVFEHLGHPLVLGGLAGIWGGWPLENHVPIAVAVLTAAAVLLPGNLGPKSLWRRLVSTVAIVGLGVAAIAERLDDPRFGLVVATGTALLLDHLWRGRQASNGDRLVGWFLTLLVVLLPDHVPWPRGRVLAALAVLALSMAYNHRGWVRRSIIGILDGLLASPARLLVVSFAALIVVGTILLSLPLSSTSGGIPLVDAFFTSVSATCVTGLAVLDTPTAFTGFGQVVILVLIQLGGLGIMTFAAALSVLLGRRLGVREEATAAAVMGHQDRANLEAAVATVLRVTAVTEGLGALLLTAGFLANGDSVAMAMWRGVFTSISAFCNAGFALQSDSLIPYQQSPFILITVSLLIIVGSLGPPVVVALPWLRRNRTSLHVKLVVSTTALLLVLPMGILLLTEWNHALLDLHGVHKLTNAWFQSVTLRTAGFNAIDLTTLQPASWTLCLVCMFIGGSPGSTAGGAKTTTIAVLVLAVGTALRGGTDVEVFGRRIPHTTIYEAAAVSAVGLFLAIGLLAALQVTHDLPLDLVLFEVVSALGTVGLSMGATAELDDVGKILVSMGMFAGRVGPLTLFVFIVGRQRPVRQYPLEAVQIG